MNSIKNLVNKGKWDKIYTLITKKKLDPYEKITQDNNIAHLAAINNNTKILKYLTENDPDILIKSNDDGNSPLHLLAEYGYTDLLKECMQNNVEYLNLLNNNNDSILLILYNNYSFLKSFKTKLATIDILAENNDEQNIINKNISDSTKKGDSGYKIIKLLLKYCLDNINKYKYSFLCDCIASDKINLAELFISRNYNVNKKDHLYISPFLYAVKNNNYDLINKLIEKGADINYIGPQGEHNPLIWAIKNNDQKLIDILLNNKFDVNNSNKKLDTPLHIALTDSTLSPTIVAQLLYYGDLNAKNGEGQTPLHQLCRYHSVKNYQKIIKHKKLDIFVKDNHQKRPLDYIREGDIYEFVDTVVDSYINRGNLKKCADNDKNCRAELKRHIFQTKRSIPKNKDHQLIETKLKLVAGNTASHGLFNSDTLHNMIYTVMLLKKYPSLGIPFQFKVPDKFVHDKMLMKNTNVYKSPVDKIVADLVNIYMEYFPEILPYLIVWHSSSVNYVDRDFGFMIQKCLKSPSIRIIFLKLTLITSANNTHANIIIYDKVKNTLERFEPYGNVPFLESNSLDKFIEELGKKYINPQLTFSLPGGNIGFQSVSDDANQLVKKLGDPGGYCLAWTMWYLEMRASNPDVDPTGLIKSVSQQIINNNTSADVSFITFIRNYAAQLDTMKNMFMLSANINKNNIYNVVLSSSDLDKLLRKLVAEFNSIIKKRYMNYD